MRPPGESREPRRPKGRPRTPGNRYERRYRERMTTTAAGRGPFTWRTPVRWFGFACLMASAFFAGYVAWLLWGTGLETARAQRELRAGVERSFENPRPVSEAPPPGTRAPLGSAYAAIVIPTIDLDFIVVEGTDHDSLKEGAGHYPDTADPWDGAGRVGIAGHRTTYLAPFFDLEDVVNGDRILADHGVRHVRLRGDARLRRSRPRGPGSSWTRRRGPRSYSPPATRSTRAPSA